MKKKLILIAAITVLSLVLAYAARALADAQRVPPERMASPELISQVPK